jgi:xanthine dehydrogenase accessory factor
MLDIYDLIGNLQKQNKAAALVTVIDTKGSTPRECGAKMLIDSEGNVYGTIGGSSVEALAVKQAKECIRTGKFYKQWHDLDDQEKADTGMICGGKMEIFIEPIAVPAHLYIFGGGHVALPLARLAAQTGFSYTIVEDRPEFASTERFPEARQIIRVKAEEIENKIQFLDTDFVAIVSRSHEIDYQVLKIVLKNQLRYIGLIASKVKKKQVFARLHEEGFPDQKINQIHAPIGLPISAQTPEEIAVSIMAELIQIKNNSI